MRSETSLRNGEDYGRLDYISNDCNGGGVQCVCVSETEKEGKKQLRLWQLQSLSLLQ